MVTKSIMSQSTQSIILAARRTWLEIDMVAPTWWDGAGDVQIQAVRIFTRFAELH